MSEAVLDAPVVLKWFAPEQRIIGGPRGLWNEYGADRLTVTVLALLFLELLQVAGRRWGWDEGALLELAEGLDVSRSRSACRGRSR